MSVITLAQIKKLPCKNCRRTVDHHFRDQKCYFEASHFEPDIDWESYFEHQKLAILTAFAIPAEMLNGEQSTRKEPHEPVDEESQRLGRSNS
jgi:hypothetical protein